MGSSVMIFLNRRVDDLFIGVFLGPALLGVYSVAFRGLLVMLDISIKTVSTVALPTFSRLQDDVVRLRTAYLTATRLSAAVALPMFLFMVVAAGEVIQVAFGPKWEASIPVMRILALIGVANTLTNFNGTVLTALGRPDIVFRFQSLGGVANVLGVAIAVHWGILAVAVALVARTWFIFLPLSVYYLLQQLDFSLRQYFGEYLAAFLASLLAMLLALGVHIGLSTSMGPAARLVIMLAGGALAYVAALAVIDRSLLRQLTTFAATILRRKGGRLATVRSTEH
jgi:PST family polysaccharide transporter